ncbi:MAG: hypothetical protein LBU34_12035 [Planctomycetaceae bacterium]|nr:hypothetical protein [Planctomycetaceae bacterium]
MEKVKYGSMNKNKKFNPDNTNRFMLFGLRYRDWHICFRSKLRAIE